LIGGSFRKQRIEIENDRRLYWFDIDWDIDWDTDTDTD